MASPDEAFTLWCELSPNATAAAEAWPGGGTAGGGAPIARVRADHSPMSLQEAGEKKGGAAEAGGVKAAAGLADEATVLAMLAAGRAAAAPFGKAGFPQSLSAVATARWPGGSGAA